MPESVRHIVREIYSEVLFELAEEAGCVDEVMDDLESVVRLLQDEPEFAGLISSPELRGEEKSQIVRRVFKGKISDLALDFLSVLAKRGRIAFLANIFDQYEVMLDAQHSISLVEVTLARKPEAEKLEKLKDELSAALKTKVKMKLNVDPDILGGMVLQIGDKMIDNSLRSILNRAVDAVVEKSKVQQRKNKPGTYKKGAPAMRNPEERI